MPFYERKHYPRVCRHRSAGVNRFGDLVCPACGTNHVTHPGMTVRPGAFRCTRCHLSLAVGPGVAELANERRARLEADPAYGVLLVFRSALGAGSVPA